MLSKETHDALAEPDRFMLRRLGSMHVKGKHEQLEVYESGDADPPALITHKQNTADRFASAIAAFEAGDITRARGEFAAIASTDADDGPAQYYVARCDESLGYLDTRSTAEGAVVARPLPYLR